MVESNTSPEKQCSRCGETKPATAEYFCRRKRSSDGLHSYCKICNSKYVAAWYAANREKALAQDKTRRLANPEKKRLRNRAWARANPEKVLAKAQRRRARKTGLPACWTTQHRQLCRDYWHGLCPVCEKPLHDLFKTIKPHASHWIPLTYSGGDNPGTVPGNMLYLCSACNLSQNKRHPNEWLIQRYGKRKANVIIRRIETYFEWINQQ